MNYIADLHIHSSYSRATSRESTLAGLFAWARIKGIQVIGTGDFTHPGWFSRLREELEPAEPGLFRLKDESKILSPLPGVPLSSAPVRFLLSAEISSIYKRHGAVRKVHNLLYVPDLESAARISGKLAGIGNIESDGRPILGLDSRDLLEILLEQAAEGFLVPAHIWTPWFSLFGSRSGFDSMEECYGDLTEHIFALETGLSSDPDMNRLISPLDRFTLISNSDCHSPGKLGREANLFSTGLDFFSLRDALRGNRRESFQGTVEFFPEEGKYHYDGHRNCGVCLDPHESRRLGLLCPVCGKPLTVGVHHRVMELADRDAPLYPSDAPEVFSLIPLPEVLGELLGVGAGSKEVLREYGRTIGRFGSEFNLLLKSPLEEIRSQSLLLGEAVERIRSGRVIRQPGYDGEFGVIKVFQEGELATLSGQGSLFGDEPTRRVRRKKVEAFPLSPVPDNDGGKERRPVRGANPEQEAAIASDARHLLVAAGPGTGKTFTLVARLVRLLGEGGDPGKIVVITFTTRAADEIRERLTAAVGPVALALFVGTFHNFSLHRLRRESGDLTVVGPESRERLLRRLFPGMSATERKLLSQAIADHFLKESGETCLGELNSGEASLGEASLAPTGNITRYLDELERLRALDLDGIIPALLRRLREDAALLERVRSGVKELFVDEFQDLNAGQFQLVRFLAQSCRVFAIGDPDQAIYGFRGSDPAYFYRFAEFAGCERLSLGANYRSTPVILQAATAVISHNLSNSGLSLVAANPGGKGGIERYHAATPAAEAEFIVRRIEELMGGIEHFSLNSGRGGTGEGRGRSFGDFALLYRIGRQGEELAQALERRGIPFQTVGSTPFYLSPLLRGAYWFLQAAAGSEVMTDWLLLLGELKGIGEIPLQRLEEALPLTGDFFSLLPGVEIAPAARQLMESLRVELERFRSVCGERGIADPLASSLEFLGIDPGQGDARRLLELAGSFGTDLPAFSRHLRRYAAETVYDQRAEAVGLMTLHAAKGLEFPVLFMAGVEEGLLPCTLWGDTDIEEERRLCYVGLTRAKERLILTSSEVRPWAGPAPRRPSRFLAEIPEVLVTQYEECSGKKGKKPKESGQMELF